ncbi:hypothetical protein A250_15683, partial [Pseudomonas syringae pv. actinidiae ICMP 9617]
QVLRSVFAAALFNPAKTTPTLPINNKISTNWNCTLSLYRLILRAVNKRHAHTRESFIGSLPATQIAYRLTI